MTMRSRDEVLRHLAGFDFEGHDEQTIREQWISQLLLELGYGLGTPNVILPKTLELRPPLRALGSKTWKIDYAPTVLGVGMFILEAKHPDEDPFEMQHLGQAWCYATDPRISVPLIVMTNGRRLGIFDLTKPEWDDPIVDVAHEQIGDRFSEIEVILGARHVAAFVRARQLAHMKRALEAEVDPSVLDQTQEELKEVISEARKTVGRNRSQLIRTVWEESSKEREQAIRELGIAAFADLGMSPYVPVMGDVWLCVEILKSLRPDERAGALEQLEHPRPLFAAQVLQLAVVLRLTDDDVIASYCQRKADEIVAAWSAGFACDPLARALHHFEIVMTAFVARIVAVGAGEHFERLAARLRGDIETPDFLRADAAFGLSAPRFAARLVDTVVRKTWLEKAEAPREELEEETEHLREFVERVGPQHQLELGGMGDPYFDLRLEHDPLRPSALNLLRDVERDESLSKFARSYAGYLRFTHFPDEDARR